MQHLGRWLVCLSVVLTFPSTALADDAGEVAKIAAVLDDFHAAAADADEERYFGHLAASGVFLGTDATERWTKEQFRAYAHPHFAKGKTNTGGFIDSFAQTQVEKPSG